MPHENVANSGKMLCMDATKQPSPLPRLRAERGWSQMKLAASAGVSLPTIQRLERGAPNMTLGPVVKVAHALGVDPAEIHPVAAMTSAPVEMPEWFEAFASEIRGRLAAIMHKIGIGDDEWRRFA